MTCSQALQQFIRVLKILADNPEMTPIGVEEVTESTEKCPKRKILNCNFSFASYTYREYRLNCSLNCSSQSIDYCEISFWWQKLQGWQIKSYIRGGGGGGGYDFMSSMCRSFNDLLVVDISGNLIKYWACHGILWHVALSTKSYFVFVCITRDRPVGWTGEYCPRI